CTRQATTVFLCTSSPQQHEYSTSIGVPLSDRSRCVRGCGVVHTLGCVLPGWEPQAMVPRDTQVKLVCGLVAPDEARPRASAPIAADTPLRHRATYFHPATVAVHRGENWSENSPARSRARTLRAQRGHEQLLKKVVCWLTQ